MKVKKIGIAVVVALLALGLTSIAVAYKSNDEGSNPAVRFVAEDSGGDRAKGGSDDPAGHDANDDHGGDRPEGVSDDPAGHDANDDHGGDDDHDANDDHGGDDD
jgi:hypothetical protein